MRKFFIAQDDQYWVLNGVNTLQSNSSNTFLSSVGNKIFLSGGDNITDNGIGTIFSLNPDGSTNWIRGVDTNYTLGNGASAMGISALGSQVIKATTDGLLSTTTGNVLESRSITDGSLDWQIEYPSDSRMGNMSLNSDGNIYLGGRYGSTDGCDIVKLDASDGSVVVGPRDLSTNGVILQVVSTDSYVYILMADTPSLGEGEIVVLNKTTLATEYSIDISNLFISDANYATACIDVDSSGANDVLYLVATKPIVSDIFLEDIDELHIVSLTAGASSFTQNWWKKVYLSNKAVYSRVTCIYDSVSSRLRVGFGSTDTDRIYIFSCDSSGNRESSAISIRNGGTITNDIPRSLIRVEQGLVIKCLDDLLCIPTTPFSGTYGGFTFGSASFGLGGDLQYEDVTDSFSSGTTRNVGFTDTSSTSSYTDADRSSLFSLAVTKINQ